MGRWSGGLFEYSVKPGQFDYSVYPLLPFEILSSQRVGRPSFHLLKVVWGGVVVRWWWSL